LTATVKLVNQGVDARRSGGDLFPLVIKIQYDDSNGNLHEWRRSFYFSGDPPDLSDTSRVLVPVGEWESTGDIRDERQKEAQANGSSDLVTLNEQIFNLKAPGRNPADDVAVVKTIEIYGSGPNIQSWITGISLLAR
jgi:hypothetical protein